MTDLKVKSQFHVYREKYQPRVPAILNAKELIPVTSQVKVLPKIQEIFSSLCRTPPQAVHLQQNTSEQEVITSPLRIGCVLSGGQAAGGHNVIVGLYEYIKRRHVNSQLFGFLNGPIGIYEGKYVELNGQTISFYKNRGGFDMICSGRNKIETEEQFAKSKQYCEALKLDGIVVIGGDDSNTNACLLADYFSKNGCNTQVVGCPKTIDGDLKNEFVEVSFGFDTACQTYSELIGNIMLDTLSTQKYYHFVRLMGRSASHITLQCALLTRPNYAFIGEEVEARQSKLSQIVKDLVDMIVRRSNAGKDYGVILVPEGLIEFICEVNALIQEINTILAQNLKDQNFEINELFVQVSELLTPASKELLNFLPRNISEQLLLDRDPHGNVQVAQIQTEKLLIEMAAVQLQALQEKGLYKGTFSPQAHYFGYEGRCAFPTNFDCDYCYSLGVNAAVLIEKGVTGVMSCIRNLTEVPEKWVPGGYPLVTMMDVEHRKGKDVPVIKKALTELDGPLFKLYAGERENWSNQDFYRSIGPIQFEFPTLIPFLVKAPALEELYFQETKTYTKNVPFAPVDPKHSLSQLGAARIQDRTAIPPILTSGDYSVVLRNSLPYSSEILQNSVDNNWRYVSKESSRLAELLPSKRVDHDSQQVPVKKGLKIGISFNGRQAPGANGIIQGLLRFCESNGSTLLGFIGGSRGVLNNDTIQITRENFEIYINQGGFHFLGRTADKLRTPEELAQVKKTTDALSLDGLVLVGATHTLSDALLISDFLLKEGSKTRVVTIPCTVDNNIGHHMLESIVGFDSASKLYSQLIGNIMIDAASAVQYWYFIRLMGRDPSHLVLECALQTQPNITIISEEVAARGANLDDVVQEIADVIVLRSKKKKYFGTLLVPEGFLAHLPQFKQLIEELNGLFRLEKSREDQEKLADQLLKDPIFVQEKLSPWAFSRFNSLPDFTQKQLLLQREVNGGVQLSQIETERLLAYLVGQELKERKKKGEYSASFAPITHFFGYQGRSATPSLFDSQIATTYGFLSGVLVSAGLTGYCTTARGVTGPSDQWQLGGIPLINMTQIKGKSSYGENMPIISSNQVDLQGNAFLEFKQRSEEWKMIDYYSNPGPTQFFGQMSREYSLTLRYNHLNYNSLIQQIEKLTSVVSSECRFGTHQDILRIVVSHLENLGNTIDIIKKRFV